MSTKQELRKGLKQTSQYLFSHHKPENHDRCYSLPFYNREIKLCARCTGIYPGLIAGIFQIFYLQISPVLWITATLGIPTLIEKYYTSIRNYKGYNSIRTLTGFFLGIGYINGIYLLAQNTLNPIILLIGLFYIVTAAWLIFQQRQKGMSPN